MSVAVRPKTKGPLLLFMNNFANHFVKALLRSPLHSLLSRRIILISVTGLRSGRVYTTPVNYVQDGNTVTLSSSTDRTWWRNLRRPGTPVTLCIEGRELRGHATVLDLTPGETARAYANYVERLRGRPPKQARVAQRAPNRVMIRIELD